MKNNKLSWLVPSVFLTLLLLIFYMIVPLYVNYGDATVFNYAMASWGSQTGYEHGYVVIPLMIIFAFYSMKKAKKEVMEPSNVGLLSLIVGIVFYILSVRTIQPRVALFAFPFIVVGVIHFSCGWKIARHYLFPAFFLYFAVTLPGLQQATNNLQVFITKFCHSASNWAGIETVIRGNNIESATGKWDELKIAEGCSGIRSIIALTMVSSIYAMYTQDTLWKKWFIFSCSLPIAIATNAIRIFTIIIIAEMGYGKFAAGVYHDYTGLIIFFPAAIACLFLIDKIINRKDNKKKMVKTIIN